MICLSFACPVHMFPWSRETNWSIVPGSRIEAVETLNSKNINVTPKNSDEKPVFDGDLTANRRIKRGIESKNSAPTKDKYRTDGEYNRPSDRQLNVPFLAVPANWVATFDPTNAVLLANHVPLRIWAVGNVAKFPTFLENIVQRIQSYYSTYKYQDLSRPVSHAIINPQYHQHQVTNIQTMDNFDSPENLDGIDYADPIDDDSAGFDTETASTLDYFDSTTEVNYSDLSDESTEINESIEVVK